MSNIVFGFWATAVLFGLIWGWKGLLCVLLFGVIAWFAPQQKPGPLTKWVMKLGNDDSDDSDEK